MNGPNTHGEFQTIRINGGKPFTAFVDGIPDLCQHRWNGSTVFETKKGKTIDWKTYPAWRSYTSIMRDELIQKLHGPEGDQADDPIVGGGVSCSKCGKPYQPDMFAV